MKKLFLSAPLLLLLSCNKGDDRPTLEMLWLPLEFTIPAGTNAFQTYHFYKKNVPTNYFTVLSAAGKTTEEVTGIEGASGTLDADFATAEYKYLQEVSIKLYHEDSPNSDLEAFYQDIISVTAGNRLVLNPSTADLEDFLKTDKISVDIAIRPRGTTPESIPSRLALSFKIKL